MEKSFQLHNCIIVKDYDLDNLRERPIKDNDFKFQ